ncbi:unnamed protein product [Adineta ricciae]|uniref:Uncharacterized protein n=1 Tax=Adineta ricciae TaxID=249248 RepID=A0A814VXD0_ADIRI|nr:unnamed protein product [Adineta ricciae]CAF1197126.1 unnamed protein product [Adineta ricciae]
MCSIYLLCGTISDGLNLLPSLLPNHLALFDYTTSFVGTSSSMCKLIGFACSCDLASQWCKINSLKTVPSMVKSAILYNPLIGIQMSLLSLFVLLIFGNATRSRNRGNDALPSRMNRQFIRAGLSYEFYQFSR